MPDKNQLLAGASGPSIGLSQAPAIVSRPMTFGDSLRYEDRETLRSVVRKVHRRYFRDPPTNAQCDQLIEALGPETQRKLLMAKIEADGSL